MKMSRKGKEENERFWGEGHFLLQSHPWLEMAPCTTKHAEICNCQKIRLVGFASCKLWSSVIVSVFRWLSVIIPLLMAQPEATMKIYTFDGEIEP